MSAAEQGDSRYLYRGSARAFGFYELKDADQFVCRCGWSGRFDEMSSGFYRELVDGSCPTCDTMLVIRSFPDLAETRHAAATRDPQAMEALASAEAANARGDRARSLELQLDSPLPALEGEVLRFAWDLEEADGERWTIIYCAGVEVWRELAYWGGRDRFAQVESILMERFGARFAGLHPTDPSRLYLVGD